MSKQKTIAFINYYDTETKKHCLDGLTDDEQKIFQSMVLKQFEKGIKIKINYKVAQLSEYLADTKA